MNNSQWSELAFQMLLAFPELSSILVSVLQIVGIATGIFVLRWCHKQDSSWVYVVCLVGVFAAMLLLPLHLARSGWAYSIPRIQHEPSAAVTKTSDLLDHFANQQATLNSFPTPHEPLPVGEQEFSFDEAIAVSNGAPLSDFSPPTNSWSILQIAISIYAIVVLSQLIRIARGWQRLRTAAQRGLTLGDRSSRLVEECRHRLNISSRVLVLRSTEVAMPLTFGVTHPVVLLPVDFEEWTTLEQQAVALHEFSHIARRDVLGELLVRSMQSLYWIHPASHWIAKQVRAAREGATDQRVIATGFSPQEYASCLVQILERERTRGKKRRNSIPSIAMSAYGDMEVRINSILRGEIKMDFARRSIWIICLVLFLCFSMVRLQAVPTLSQTPVSDDSSDTTSEPTQPKASPSQAQPSSGEVTDSNPSTKNDFLDLIQNAPLTSNVSTPDGIELNLSGVVLAPNGEPVCGCTVVLSHLNMGQRIKMIRGDDGDIRLQSLLARTKTDEEGRFRIANIFVPKDSPDNGDLSEWTGNLIAGDGKLGIGWETFGSVRERRITRVLNIRLYEIDSIEGQCLNSDGTPANETKVVVSGLGYADHRRSGLFLCGALHVNTLTDSNGRFQFFQLPGNAIASISASGSSGIDNLRLRISTKQGSNATDLERIALPPGMQLQSGPALLTLKQPIQIKVRVINTKGDPISGAKLFGEGLNQETDHQGMILWTVHPKYADARVASMAANQETRILISFENASPYLGTEKKVRWDSITESKPIDIIVEKGTRVRGKVITEEGSSAPGVYILESTQMGQYSTVNKEGDFELIVPKKKCRLFLCGSQGSYRVPSAEQVRKLYRSTSETPQNWKYVDIDATSGNDIEIPTIVVQKTEPIHIVAQLPDGSPATNATVILTDIDISKEDRNTYFRKSFLSMNTFIDSNGLATILPIGIPSKLASVEVRLLHENIPYLGIVGVDPLSAGKLLVRLKPEWLIRGRVSLDGQPLPGAWVHAIRNVSPKGETLRPESVLHCRMTTNQLGEYEFIMPRDHDYEIQVSSLPQDSSPNGSTHKLIRQTENEMEVPEFRYERGTESITGTVCNLKGEPIAGANVFILGNGERLWIGQSESSFVKSDKSGQFVMRNLPRGSVRLRATWNDTANRSVSSREVLSSSGETNVHLIVPTSQRVDLSE